ncbi:MAG: 50S ribosomal protein L10 [Parcubacteria group bacterium]
MPKTKQQKEKIISALTEKLRGAKSIVMADFTGLTVVDTWLLRDKCVAENVELMAAKKTLLKIALKGQGIEIDAKSLPGSMAVAISHGDEVTPARIIKDFAKTHEQLTFRAGILEGRLISAEALKALANLPSRLELLAKAVGSIKAPISGFVNVLSGNLRGLVRVLDAIKNTKS